jgi:D-glycero-D-manno-heptose 1,7-bisphosphate phosphatase
MTSSTRASSWPFAVPSAVLFDRDGTLVVDVPHNGDPDLVQLVQGAEEAVAAVREAGVANRPWAAA